MASVRTSWFAFILIMLSMVSCRFVQSLYIQDVEDRKLNESNLKRIAAIEPSTGSDFQIAVISDSHDYYSPLKKQVDYINDHKDEISFVLHTGDATNLGLANEWEMFYDEIKELEVPFVFVVGNHDLLSNGEDIYKQMFGSRFDFFFDFKQTRFILFNNNTWESRKNVPDIGFLNTALGSSSATHNILLAHVSGRDSERFNSQEVADLESLVSSSNVKYFLNGHDHNSATGTFGTATRVTVGSSFKGQLLLMNFTNAGVTHEFVDP